MQGTSAYLRQLGLSARAASAKARLLQHCDRALDVAGASKKRWSIWVPGRVELLGKHTDYAGGRSLIAAIERGICLRAAFRKDELVRVIDVGDNVTVEVALGGDGARGAVGLPHYVSTVARRVASNFRHVRYGVDMALASDLPPAAGLSSSSALVVAVFIAISKANDLQQRDDFRKLITTREELAAYLGAIENGEPFGRLPGDAGVGTLGGAQDHTAILCSEVGQIARFAYIPVRRESVVSFPPRHTLVIAVSGVVAEKTGAALPEYNRASMAVRRLVEAWNREHGRHDLSLAEAVGSAPDAPRALREIADRLRDPELPAGFLRRRLEQFLTEAFEVIPAATDALQRQAVAEFGVIADQSQRMAEELLGNQVPQTIALQRSARELGASAASAFGAGFGGSVWAIVPDREARHFVEDWEAKYRHAYPGLASRCLFFTTPLGPAAAQW